MTSKVLVWVLVALLTLVSEWYGHCYGCLEEERMGLLKIQAVIDPDSFFLRDWVNNNEGNANCCEWSGIECDNTTSRVIQLYLDEAYDRILGDWILNASLFLPFTELQSLYLRENNLVGFFENEGFKVLSLSLRKLENLDLGGNKYNDSIFSSLSGLSSLKSLDLSGNMLTGTTNISVLPMRLRKLQKLYLNGNQLSDNVVSILSGLSSLKYLDLSRNMLTASGINGFEILSSQLRELEDLDLSYNKFSDTILTSLSGFSSLKSLDLSGNMLLGSTAINGLRKLEVLHLDELHANGSNLLQSLGALPFLKTLSLRNSNLRWTSMISQGNFINSTSLEGLFLDYSYLPMNFLQNIGALSSLKALSFRECDLEGTLPHKGWCELKNLELLDLSVNNLRSSLPTCLGNLSSLQLLDFSSNQFTGNIASSPLTNLISLKYLALSSNHFQVPVSFESFTNHSKLKFFICNNNMLIAGPSFQNFINPKFQLLYFSMSESISTGLSTEIPKFLYNQYNLRALDLSRSNFSGMFPWWLLKNNTRLEQLYTRENFFVGALQLQNHPNPNMTIIDLSKNNLHGQIPKNMCMVFPNLWTLRMAGNELTGSSPSCFENMSSLASLDLSDNHLSEVKLKHLRKLEFIKLSKNNMGGQISPSVLNSSTLQYLSLAHNNLEGQISDFQLNRWKNWSVLDLSNNNFSGVLPRWFANMSFLYAIDFSNNLFEGPIPVDFCKLKRLEYLDLSHNNLYGSLPNCIDSRYATHVHLRNNRLSGPITNAFYNSSSLVTLDLSHNNFTGSIPDWIGSLSSLSALLLRANHFDGEFPVELCLLEQLSLLDVSQNNLSGALPSCLSNFTFKGSWKKAFVDPHEGSRYKYAMDMNIYYEMMGPLLLESIYSLGNISQAINFEETVEFTTKRMTYGYEGKILIMFSGIDLSCNNFSGEIPLEFGNISEIRELNLSHNNLIGSIPATLSRLEQVEVLDLSYNNLKGAIPPQLTQMTFLEVFCVAYNNLSGKTPEMKYQFGTFDNSSYEGNPFLCGPPLQNNCSEEVPSLPPMPNEEREEDGFIDMYVFYVSFGVCYSIVVLAISAILYINPYWRRRWFNFIENFIDTCYYFVVASFRKFSNFRR